jgi:hypothetical protein
MWSMEGGQKPFLSIFLKDFPVLKDAKSPQDSLSVEGIFMLSMVTNLLVGSCTYNSSFFNHESLTPNALYPKCSRLYIFQGQCDSPRLLDLPPYDKKWKKNSTMRR